MRKKLIIDADAGIGDALAVALALSDDRFDVLAVTGCAGCVSGERATRNLEATIAAVDPARWPRCGESHGAAPIVDEELLCEIPHPRELQGDEGLGSWLLPPVARAHHEEADRLLIETVHQHPNEVTLLALGPLTNVLRAAEADPNFFSMLGSLVCQGGAVACGGDVSATAEFNISADPDAAKAVLLSAITRTLVPLDATNSVVLSMPQFDRLPAREASNLARFVRDLLPFAFRVAHQKSGQEGIYLREVAALCSIVEPQLFERERMIIDVETAGELTRGMTVFDRRHAARWRNNIDVLMQADGQGVVDYLHRIVTASR